MDSHGWDAGIIPCRPPKANGKTLRREDEWTGAATSFTREAEFRGFVAPSRILRPFGDWKDRSIKLGRHNRADLHSRRDGVERHERQVGIHRRVEQARHRADDARNADLWRFRRVETVRPPDRLVKRFRVESLASQRSVVPILLAPSHDTDA